MLATDRQTERQIGKQINQRYRKHNLLVEDNKKEKKQTNNITADSQLNTAQVISPQIPKTHTRANEP